MEGVLCIYMRKTEDTVIVQPDLNWLSLRCLGTHVISKHLLPCSRSLPVVWWPASLLNGLVMSSHDVLLSARVYAHSRRDPRPSHPLFPKVWEYSTRAMPLPVMMMLLYHVC